MTSANHSNATGLVVVDPYNDFISEGGAFWDRLRDVAQTVGCVPNMVRVLDAARRTGVAVFYAPHHRWRPGDYAGWRYWSPIQRRNEEERIFADGTWGGTFREEFTPLPGETVVDEHWCSSGFANTDLDLQLKKHGVHKLIVIGCLANTCIDSTVRFAVELGYEVTLIKDAIAAFGWDAMHASLDVNLPNYAQAIISTDEVIERVSAPRV